VGWYLRFGLSYRDVEELLAERGIEVDHVSIYRWVQRFAPEFIEAARARQHVVGDRWHVDETYVKVGGAWRYLFRAIDQFGQVIDVFLSSRRDAAAARRFFDRAIDRTRVTPVEVTTDGTVALGEEHLHPGDFTDEISPSHLPPISELRHPVGRGRGVDPLRRSTA
jgi:transposase-like protein